MTLPRRELASGAGWRALDVLCTAGPADPSVEEQHDAVNIALVLGGTFQHRNAHGEATLTPGSIMLGNHGACFECGHDHGTGDRCLAFHFAPETFEEALSETPGVSMTGFVAPSLPPLAATARLFARAQAARDDGDADAFEELAFEAATTATTMTAGVTGARRSASASDQRRVSEAIRRIESDPTQRFPLADLACAAAMSRYHFLRVFRDVAGVTPHQYVLHQRLHLAAVRLLRSADPVAAIAYDCGFEDLSTFNRRFRRVMGDSPEGFRARR